MTNKYLRIALLVGSFVTAVVFADNLDWDTIDTSSIKKAMAFAHSNSGSNDSHFTAKLDDTALEAWFQNQIAEESISPQAQAKPLPKLPAATPTAPILPTVQPVAQPAAPAAAATPAPATPAPTTPIPPLPQRSVTPLSSTPTQNPSALQPAAPYEPQNGILINFNNVSIIEYLRFISRISNKNFIFDENDLEFNVTIISEEPTSLENIMAALVQELRIHGFLVLEQGNNLIIHQNPAVSNIPNVISENLPGSTSKDSELVTQVFHLNSISPTNAAIIIQPLVSQISLVTTLLDTNYLIITDLVTNIREVAKLLKSVDAPAGGVVVGQYAYRNGSPEVLLDMATKIMEPIVREQQINYVVHQSAHSIFVVASPFLVEQALVILEHLDRTQGITGIYNLQDKRFSSAPGQTPTGQWIKDAQGNWVFYPRFTNPVARYPDGTPKGYWLVDQEGSWYFVQGDRPSNIPDLGGPKGHWYKDQFGRDYFQLDPGEDYHSSLAPGQGYGTPETAQEQVAQKETRFLIHKLQYRKGDEVQQAIQNIAESIQNNGTTNGDLAATINSVQWLEPSNALIFTGPPQYLAKVKELVEEIDIPLRQVYIEMLILDTTITDSLQYGVNFLTNFGGNNVAGAQAFLSNASTLPAVAATSGIVHTAAGAAALFPNATGFVQTQGYNLGIIGQSISHNGQEFGTIGALVNALHDRTTADIVMNPKIITQDGAPAEIFVGLNTQFPTQAISNDLGSIITQNFEFRDVGATLKVTPYISPNNMITMDIDQEVSSIDTTATGLQSSTTLSNTPIGPTTRVSRTTTRVHVPNGYFLIISGMIQDEYDKDRQQVPCLGGIPVLGALFSARTNLDTKRNIMIFIRPQIIESEEQIDNLTKHQQDVFRYKCKSLDSWKYEVEGALDFFNVKSPMEEYCDPDAQ